MAKKTLYILSVIFLIISIDNLIGIYLTSLYEKNYCQHAGGDVNYYLKHGNSDTLVIGSSRVNTMINPDILGKNIVNISKPSKHLYYNISIIHLLKQYNKLPKNGLILLSIEFEDFYLENEKKMVEDVYYLKYYYSSNDYIHTKINKTSKYEPFKFLSSSYRFNGDNFKLFTNQFQHICDGDINGYYPISGKLNIAKYKSFIKNETIKKSSEINSNAFNELKNIHDFCVNSGVNLYLISAPLIYQTKRIERIKPTVKNFCKKNNIEFLDFSSKEKFNDLNLWADIMHLNKEGSIIYTNLIKEKLNQLKKNDN